MNNKALRLPALLLFVAVAYAWLAYAVIPTVRNAWRPAGQSASESAPATIEAPTAEDILNEVNLKRQEAGVAPLKSVASLKSSAGIKAAELYREGPTGPDSTPHVSASGTRGVQILLEHNDCGLAAENISWGWPTARQVVDGWMSSVSHREVMLSATYSSAGVATDHQYYVLHLCG